jgi:hypothetical protein
MRCPDFRQRVTDRWGELRATGVLEVSNLFGVIDSLADPLAEAAVRNFTKWDILATANVGFPTPVTSTWEEQITFMKGWLVQRMTWLDAQFPGRVTFSHPSGTLAAGTPVTLHSPVTRVYTTTDGSDPRLPGGSPNPSAVAIGAGHTYTVASSVDFIARSWDGSKWSAPTTATWVVGTAADAANLAVTELNYHPSDPTPAESLVDPAFRDDDFEFVELKNLSADPIDLSGIRFVEGIAFAIPAPAVLAPGGYALLVANLAAFEARYGAGLPVLGVYAGKLDNDGDTLRLAALDGTDLAAFTFNDTWFRPTDGEGFTLVVADESALPANGNDPASWGISCQLLGNPGAPNGNALSQSFAGWRNYHFTPAEIADPLASGFDADLDLDGIVTLLEFALGLDPKAADPSGLPAASSVPDGGSDYLALTFRRWKKPLGLTYRVEVSDDLMTWIETAVQIGPAIDNGDGTETVTIRDALPIDSNAPKRFIRLSVSAW